MNIVIVGAGTIGINLAAKLSEEGHDLFLIDENKQKLRNAEESLDVKTIHGDATSVDILRAARTGDAQLMIAVTDEDAVNILACQVGAKLGAKKKIARIREAGCFTDASVLIPYDLGIDLVIYPEEEVANEIWQLLHHPYASEVNPFFDDEMKVVGLIVHENSILVGKSLNDVLALSRHRFLIVGIVRDDDGFIPVDWDGQFQPDDSFYVVSHSSQIDEIVEALGFESNKSGSVFIYGGNTIGLNLAKRLDHSKLQARILEPERSRSHELAYELKKVLVLHGEGTDSALLEGEGIEEADVFVAVTDDEEANLLSCILAKKMGALKSIALVTKPDYIPLISTLGVDAVLSKRLTTINRIMQFVLHGEVVSVSELSEGKIDAIEFRVTNNSIASGMEIGSREFKEIFPSDATIGSVQFENGESVVPNEATKISVGDKVMVYASRKAVKEVEKIFV